MKLVHHGAHEGVTGSCHQLWIDDSQSLLVDCGTFQGEDARKKPNPEIEFSLRGIQALLLTHVHIDHAGRIPYLLAAGFDHPILCSAPTAKLLPLVMEDALKIGFTRSKRLIKKFLGQIRKLLVPLPYHQWHDCPGGVKVRLLPAGHVLGSTMFEIELADGRRAVFSGDVGAGTNPLLNPPASPERADLLVLESTYGDRLHPPKADRQAELEAVIRRTLHDSGVTIVPAFSLGRTQALLYELNAIFERIQETEDRTLMKRVDVIVDSPLASRFTALYKEMKSHWGEEAQVTLKTDDQPLVFENLTTVGSHTEHKETVRYLAKHNLPAVVIAGSGMCTGGRVVNYLKEFIGQEETDIVFAGYQAGGTPGNYISRGSDWVRLDGRRYDVRAKTHQLTGYSAHGDQQDLIALVDGMADAPKEIRLVHGDYAAKRALTQKLTEKGYHLI